jgi:oxygen-dependent protoporphyrinogen oxidase
LSAARSVRYSAAVRDTIAVVGGGVSGLAVTFHLRRLLAGRGDRAEVLCLEAGARPGGNIATSVVDGFTCEWGPNGFLDNEPATLELVRDLGISDRLLPSRSAAARRFVFRRGRLRPLPDGPISFLRSGVLSPLGKLRVLCEPFGPGPPEDGDESVFDFASRRIGKEAAAVLVDAMVSGIFAGDARNLSLRAAFPKMWAMENEHGGLLRAMRARRRARKSGDPRGSGGPAGPGGTLTSFKTGMRELIDALAAAVSPALRTGCRVERIVALGGGGYRLHLAAGLPADAAAIVLACPAWFASSAVASLDPEMSDAMAAIPSAPVAVVHLGYRAGDLNGAPVGFGFLAPRGEGVRILGCLWSSSIFEGRATDDRALLTCMVGGATDPEAMALSDAELVEVSRRDLATCMKVVAEPTMARVFRHLRGIPQYTLGHPARVAAIERRLERFPGLTACGNSYRGISVNACALEAPAVAASVLRHLEQQEESRPPG